MQNNPHSRREREIFPAFLGKVRKENLSAAPRFRRKRCAGDYPFRLAASRQATLPLLSLRDIFPRSGGSRPSRGRLQRRRETLRQHQKASPWGSWLCVAKTEGVFPRTNPLSPLPLVASSSPEGGANPFRHRLRRCHLPQGDGFSYGGKLCGSTQRLPLGGAGAGAPEGVTPPVKRQFWKIRRFSRIAK